jgi:hypothetical protein
MIAFSRCQILVWSAISYPTALSYVTVVTEDPGELQAARKGVAPAMIVEMIKRTIE